MYFPVFGLIHLFVTILNDQVETPPSDAALLDVVCGHLARLEFVSAGTMTFTFARELSRISREVVSERQAMRLEYGLAEVNESMNLCDYDTVPPTMAGGEHAITSGDDGEDTVSVASWYMGKL